MNTLQKRITALAALAALGASTLGLPVPASAQVPPPPAYSGPVRGERHPELRRALATLRRTELELRRSARDFGGHRQKAADLCHAAQEQIQLALQYDHS